MLEDVEMPAAQLRTVDPESGSVCCASADEEATTTATPGPLLLTGGELVDFRRRFDPCGCDTRGQGGTSTDC